MNFQPINPMKKVLPLIFLTLLFSLSGFGQSAQNPSQPQTVSREKTISMLISEVKAARELIKTQDENIIALENQIKSEQENADSLEKSYTAAKSEINSLRTANDALTKAVALNEQTIALLQTDLTKERASKKKWRSRTFKIGATLAAIVLTKVL